MNFQSKFKRLLASIVVTILLFISSAPAFAETPHERCAFVGSVSGKIMTLRQNGSVVTDVIAINNQFPEMSKLLNTITMIAFDVPVFSMESNKKEAVTEFQNQMYMTCMKQIGKTS